MEEVLTWTAYSKLFMARSGHYSSKSKQQNDMVKLWGRNATGDARAREYFNHFIDRIVRNVILIVIAVVV